MLRRFIVFSTSRSIRFRSALKHCADGHNAGRPAYDTVAQARSYLPADVEFIGVRGVRVLTPVSSVFKLPPLGKLFARAEHLCCDLPGLRALGGFLVIIARKR